MFTLGRITMSSLQVYQSIAFCISWIGYGSLYFLRKPLGVIKTDLVSDLQFSKAQLGWLDTALFLPYASCQVFLGSFGDKYSTRVVFSLCLLFSALSMISFGAWDSYGMLMLLLFLNGVAQSQSWAACVKAVVDWYPDNVRNTVLGMYGTCCFAGGVMGSILAVYIQSHFGWRYVYFYPSILIAVLSVIAWLMLRSPEELNIVIPGKEVKVSTSGCNQVSIQDLGKKQTYTTLDIVRIPLVLEAAISLLFLKIVRYCMYMWLPMYLLTELNYSKAQSGIFSTVFEVGGVIGTAAIGFVIDRCFQGRAVYTSFLSFSLSTASLFCFVWTRYWGYLYNSVFMGLAGMFNSGPDSILGGALSAELGELDGRKAAAFTTAFVNGFGACGAFLQGPLVGYLYEHYGWSVVFSTLITLSTTGSLLTLYTSHRYNALVLGNSGVPQAQGTLPQ